MKKIPTPVIVVVAAAAVIIIFFLIINKPAPSAPFAPAGPVATSTPTTTPAAVPAKPSAVAPSAPALPPNVVVSSGTFIPTGWHIGVTLAPTWEGKVVPNAKGVITTAMVGSNSNSAMIVKNTRIAEPTKGLIRTDMQTIIGVKSELRIYDAATYFSVTYNNDTYYFRVEGDPIKFVNAIKAVP